MEGEKGQRGNFPPAGHSGRYLDWTVNPDSEEKTLSGADASMGSIQLRFFDAIIGVVFGTGTSILVPLIISKMEIRAV